MKYSSYILVSILFITGFLAAQTESNSISSMKTQLQNWDPVRGEWLANSLISISKGESIPDRTFPEEFTPYEMLTLVPMDRRKGIISTFRENNASPSRETSQIEYIFNHTFCQTLTGRSYGDPHLVSFDRATYSFQTVGEFVLAKSTKGHFEVQTRQKPQSDNFHLQENHTIEFLNRHNKKYDALKILFYIIA
jgi:hypothetical protein